jgi:hypothetical protein
VLGYVASSRDVQRVTLSVNATDIGSGVLTNRMEVHITERDLEKVITHDCGQANATMTSSCTLPGAIEFGPDTQIRYRVVATDQAGNRNETRWAYVILHPLANFVTHDLLLNLGSSFKGKVQVRNIQDVTDTVSVRLSQYEFAWFEGHTKDLVVRNLTPGETREFTVEIISSDPDTYSLNLTAVSENTGAVDTDSMKVVVGFPAIFPGLEAWAIAMLIALAGLMYYRRIGL